jgi:hypothetical protein
MSDDPTSPPDCQHPSPLPCILPAGGISLLAGGSGIGKTALLADFLRRLRTGEPIFGRQPASTITGVGIVNMDRGWTEGAGEWFKRVGFADIPYYSLIDDATFQPSRLRKKWNRTDILFECIDKLQLPPLSVVATDPISLFLGGNLMDYDACAVACCEIRRKLIERKLTMIATAHSRKISADKHDRYLRLQDHILGSTALLGFTDTQMYLATPEEIRKPYYAFLWQPHMVPVETFMLQRDAQGLFIPYTGSVEVQAAPTVIELLPADGSEVTFGKLAELAEAIPIRRRTLIKILEKLTEAGDIKHVRHGVYCRAIVH